MARINIEDKFWDEVAEVAVKMGDLDRAAGQALRLIRFGQQKFKEGRRITRAEFDAKFSEHLIPLFARPDGDFIEVAGASKHFDWLEKKRSAGRKGAEVTNKKRWDKGKRRQKSASVGKDQHSSPSYSSSSSLSSSSSSTVPSEQTKAGAFVVGYKKRILKKYGFSPNVQGKDAGIAARIANRLSYEEIETYLDAFFQMPDAELVKKKHPVFLFEVKINEIAAFAHTGAFTSQREANQADDSLALATQLKNIREGRL